MALARPEGQLECDASAALTVVCDNGTGLVKCGFANDKTPHIFPCVVGRPLPETLGLGAGHRTAAAHVMVGDACLAQRRALTLTYPMSGGAIASLPDMHLVWQHAFQDQLSLPADLSEHRVLLSEPALNPRASREAMVQAMFETYGFGAVNIQVQAVLTLYSQGYLTGTVVDSGDGVTHVVTVVDGYVMRAQAKRLPVAGRHITGYLLELLRRRGYSLDKATDMECVRCIKEELCYVAQDYQREKKLARETTALMENYTLPDGKVLRLGPERFLAPEALFQPSLLDVEGPGIDELTFNAINEASIDTRRALYRHIVLSGGSSMYPGLPERMMSGVQDLYRTRVLHQLPGDEAWPTGVSVRVKAPANRQHMVFQGAAVLAGIMKDQADWWISREEYEELGPQSLSKCISI